MELKNLTVFRIFTCQKCKETIKERNDLKGFTVDKIKDVELEYFDICQKCGLKAIKDQRFKLRVAGAIEMNIINYDLFNAWRNGQISQKDFLETLQNNEKMFKKSNIIKKAVI